VNEPIPQAIIDFLATSGHCLVSGGPGSGKTTLALRKAVTRLAAGVGPGQAVLFLSFSRAAVGRLIEAGAQSIPREYRNKLVVQTFHSFFWNLLGCHAYLLGAPRRLHILMPHDERALSQGIKSDDPNWPMWERERERLFYEEGRLAFDLFGPMTLRLIGESTSIKNLIGQQYPLIIVDEAQDTGQHAWEVIREMKDCVQIVSLVDPEQQIFDHLPGIGPERINAIRNELAPMEVDLGQQKNRSPGTEIAVFANDVMHGRPRGQAYIGVSRLAYHPKHDLNKTLRKALAIVYRKARESGINPESCAILATTGPQVAEITAALSNGSRPVAHRVVFDEAQALLASRFAAFLLEPKRPESIESYVIEGLELLGNLERAAGTVGGRKAAEDYRRWAEEYKGGKKLPNKGLATAMRSVMMALQKTGYCGDPWVDWLRVKDVVRNSDDRRLAKIASHLDYLVAFGRGRFLASNLLGCWMQTATYAGARAAFDSALAQDSILETSQNLGGIHVMTIHRAKGKQFDGVIVVRKSVPIGQRQWRSSFVWRDDMYPYPRSRKILRVGITRAKKHVLILDPVFPACPLLQGHSL
jgi:DNA helicase-2/ATP-dependent DNA helicase PcrA